MALNIITGKLCIYATHCYEVLPRVKHFIITDCIFIMNITMMMMSPIGFGPLYEALALAFLFLLDRSDHIRMTW